MTAPDPRHPPGPLGCPLRCGGGGCTCKVVGECHTGCCKRVACDDCGAELWWCLDIVLPDGWPAPVGGGEGVGGE